MWTRGKITAPYRAIDYDKKGHVAVIHLPCLADGRGTPVGLSADLADLCDEITWDEEIHVVVLTAPEEKTPPTDTGTAPSLSWFALGTEAEFWSLASPIAALKQPVIAAISGDALSLGLEAALACDIRIAAEGCRFGFPAISTGLIPWDGGTQRLPRIVGRAKALEMVLTGETIDAQEARRIGLVARVAPRGELTAAVMAIAHDMASKGPLALRHAKEAIHKGMDMTLKQGLRLEADLYLLLHTTLDRTEGITAFLEKRNPRFLGR